MPGPGDGQRYGACSVGDGCPSLSVLWEEGLVLWHLICSPAPSTSVPIYHPGLSGLCLSPQHAAHSRHCQQGAVRSPQQHQGIPGGISSACVLPTQSQDIV